MTGTEDVHHDRGFTLVEVMVVLSLFTVILGIALLTMSTSSSIQQSQQNQAVMQSSSRRLLQDIKQHLTEADVSAEEVDTRMRWLYEPGDDWETYDKFHTWYYIKKDNGDYYPAMLQCPEEFCGWAHNGSSYRQKFTTFATNFNYRDGAEHLDEFHSEDTDTSSNKGHSRSGRIYNDLFDPREHSQNGLNSFAGGGPTTAQCIKGNGALLYPLVQMDVLQFPTPRNLRYDYITNEGGGRGPDDQGWIIYAPYYNRQAKSLQVRRYGLFMTDLFETLPWTENKSPVYDVASGAPDPSSNKVDEDVVKVADSVPILGTGRYVTEFKHYNKVVEDGSTSPVTRPPDWPRVDRDNDGSDEVKPALKDLFDFNRNNLVETDVDADGSNTITYGSTREETESTIEQFRLYPSTSTKGYFADWTSTSDINDVSGLIYHKYTDQNLPDPFEEMEVYYFIDLKTGWTRFYYYARWNVNTEYWINASFIRRKYQGLPNDYANSELYTPYKTLGKKLIGIDFSTSKTYPSSASVPSGISSDKNAVRIGLLMDNKILHKGEFKFPSFRQETMVPLSP